MQKNNIRPNAQAIVKGGSAAPQLWGDVKFYQKADGVLIWAHIFGLPKDNKSGFFAFHIHEGTSCGGENFADSKAHFNPGGTDHPMHAGDLPPLLSCNGEAYMTVFTNRFNVRDVLGRTVIIHSGPDDFHSQPSGNPGNKIACGIIKS